MTLKNKETLLIVAMFVAGLLALVGIYGDLDVLFGTTAPAAQQKEPKPEVATRTLRGVWYGRLTANPQKDGTVRWSLEAACKPGNDLGVVNEQGLITVDGLTVDDVKEFSALKNKRMTIRGVIHGHLNDDEVFIADTLEQADVLLHYDKLE